MEAEGYWNIPTICKGCGMVVTNEAAHTIRNKQCRANHNYNSRMYYLRKRYVKGLRHEQDINQREDYNRRCKEVLEWTSSRRIPRVL